MSAGRPVAVVGVGISPILRDGNEPVERLAVSACKNAVADAGVASADIDGVFQYSFGWDSPDCHYMQQALGIPDLAAYGDIGAMGPSGLAGALDGITAVASGACETALVFRAISQAAGHTGSARGMGGGGPIGAMGEFLEFTLPYGHFPIIPTIAMMMQRRIAELGGSIEDYGAIAVNARTWAALNERAVLREPITMDDYLSSRVLAEPLHLLDCDYPVSGACAAIITTAERARDLPKQPIVVDAFAYATGPRPDWIQAEDFMYGATRRCADRLWNRASVMANDIDVALLYDGFTHIAISWIEALGFCGIGEAGDFLEGGRRIGPGGALPLNTHGGQLAAGRLHGLAHLVEAVQQLRGECSERQVPDARVAVVTNGQGPQCGALVLRAD
ncbi:MAG: thiolase family protein [Dehalococcoidia bacterium]